MAEILPSILSADFARLGEQMAALEEAGCRMLHVDVMDGHFVPNLTIGPPVVASLRKATRAMLDVHLMIEDPDNYAPRVHRGRRRPGLGASGNLPPSGPDPADDPQRRRGRAW